MLKPRSGVLVEICYHKSVALLYVYSLQPHLFLWGFREYTSGILRHPFHMLYQGVNPALM